MPYRQIAFKVENIYHVFNRTINKETIFDFDINHYDISRFFSLVDFYRHNTSISYSVYKLIAEDRKMTLEKLKNMIINVEIYAFCLMPNHYHFAIKQLQPNGISTFISKIQNGFAKYYNFKKDRQGSLFCEMFKAKRIKSDEDLKNVIEYIHQNPVIAKIIDSKSLSTYPLTSFSAYKNKQTCPFLTKLNNTGC